MADTSNSGKSRYCFPSFAVRALFALACLIATPISPAADTVCAQVKIEIKQELTLERQAFDAMMRITNGLDTTSLEGVDITVTFKDDAGNSVLATSDPNNTAAAFFIRVDTLDGISNISGTGTVSPKTVAEIHWLIIPAPGSGGTVPTGKLYFIGATLNYSVSGKAETVTVTPDFIYVKPLPLLNLDYFLTQDVFGDDPLTPVIEPIEPYTLGVRIKNVGAATAKNVKIDSAQPKIVENNQGLLIGFKIIGSFLNDQTANPSLLIPFGDIAANGTSTGRWQMTSTLMGKFIDFSATVSHSDELGGAVTSLIPANGIKTHLLIRDVKVDLPGRDNIRDFLALDGTALRVYESSGVDTVVTDLSASSVLSAPGAGPNGDTITTISTPASVGPMYVRLPDPFNGSKALSRMTRADGKVIAPENLWLSKKRNADKSLSYFVNLFDVATPGIYNVALTNVANIPHPPVLQFIADRTVREGQQVSFIVEASDPDGTVPTITTALLPAGARFNPQAPAGLLARGIFDWTPATGQAGQYPITYTASDGSLTASTTALITVTSTTPPAGPDTPVIARPEVATTVKVLDPELAVAPSVNALDTTVSYQFELYNDASFSNRIAQNPNIAKTPAGALWKVPTQLSDNSNYTWRVRAFDGTTYSTWTLARFFVNTANDAPSIPAIAAPANGASVDTTTPVLSIANSTDPDGDSLVYRFEVYADSALTQKLREIANVNAGANGTTSATIAPALADQTLYHWRAVAIDPHGAATASSSANFLIDVNHPAPGAPSIVAPVSGGVVTTSALALTVTNSTHAQGVAVKYFFELDKDKTFASSTIVRSGAILEGQDQTVFSVTGLSENARYFWRTKASDGLTESAWVYGEFFVDQANDAPSVPVPLNPGQGAFVSTRQPLLEVGAATDPEGDAIAYHFEIYSDAALTNKVAERLTASLTWLAEPMLADETPYFWRVRAEDLRGGASAFSAVQSFSVHTGASSRPRLTLVEPAGIVTVTTPTAAIAWEIDDSEHASTIALFHDRDNQGEDGTLIANNIAQDPATNTGRFTWDVSTLLPGTYYIYASATNRIGVTTRYAPGAFVIPVPQPRGGITLTPTTPLETTEAGGTASFTVALTTSPKSEVTIGFTASQPNEARLDPPELTFSAANWNVPRSITVTGLPDCVNDGDQPYQVTAARAISADVDYNGIQATALSLINRGSTVGCPTNNAPLANAGPDQTVDAGSIVVLTGSGTDSDGTIASYHWVQTAGPAVTLSDANVAAPSFTAPSPALDTLLSFELTVTDNQGAIGKDSVNITTHARPNQPPSVNAGADQTVAVGTLVTLTGSGTDADGTIASYQWAQIAGPTVVLTNANTATATFTAPAVTTQTLFGFILTVTDNRAATGAASVAVTVQPAPINRPPVVNAGVAQTVNSGAVVSLAGSATDPDGTVVSYLWTQTGSPVIALVNANTANASFTAPTVAVNTPLTFKLTATDNQNATGSASVTITVLPNQAPVVSAGAAQAVNEAAAVTLNGGATDADGSVVSYLWTQTAGSAVTLANANTAVATFTAPAVNADTLLTFKLTATDNLGAVASATTDVTVHHVNRAPTANAGTDQTVDENVLVTLSGSGTDSDGAIVSYQWMQTVGRAMTLSGANTPTATFTTPQFNNAATLTFQLTVTDNQGATGSATVNVKVRNNIANTLPTVNAGAAQTVDENTPVTLAGTASDADGSIAAFQWTQTAGPTVALTGADTATASFTAPEVTASTVLSFTLTVTDNAGATASATTKVTVRNVNRAPTADAGPDLSVNEGTPVSITGTGADSDGSIASYKWTRLAGPTVTLVNSATQTVSFTAPEVTADTVLTLQLTVKDNAGATATDNVDILIHNVNKPPVANARPDKSANEGTTVTLSSSGSKDPDGTIASFLWVQTAGPSVTLSDPTSAGPTFTALEVTGDTILTFQLTVTDNEGATGTDLINVTIHNVNKKPTADAGAAQKVKQGTLVQLTGAGIDADGSIVSFLWAQTAGPAVTLSDAASASPTFTAPSVTASTALKFQLTVTDNDGGTGVKTVTITVTP